MANSFDVIVIGAGPGGYVAAIRAAQLGMKVAVVEARKELGGTCLNVGCIPSKALLESSEHYHRAVDGLAVHGVMVEKVSLDFGAMQERKRKVVSQTVGGIEYLFKKHSITRFAGFGSFLGPNQVKVADGDHSETLEGKYIIIATGSTPTELPFAKFDEKKILSSTGALALEKVPGHLVVIGGGVIGLELGSVYARLGSKVTVIELLDAIVPQMDRELGKTLQRSLQKLGLSFQLKTKVKEIKATKKGVQVLTEDPKGKEVVVEGDAVLVSVGRRPCTAGLALDKAGVTVDKRGFIETDEECRTKVAHIYAIGDVIARGPMLAHKAEDEGMAVAEFIDGQAPEVNYGVIPGVIYTWPEVAAVGRSEEELKEAGIAYKVGKFPFKASGRARAAEESEGFVKILADAETDEILGVHMIGPRCSDLIAEAVVAMEYQATAEDIARICHAHPTYAEPIKEAALMATADRPIHI